MDFLAIRRSLYYLFQIFLNVSLLWMHGETNGQWLAHKKAVAERERQLSLKNEVWSYIVWNFFLLVLLMLRFIAKRHLIYTLAETNTKYVHAVMHICRYMDRYMFWDWVQIKFSRWKHCYSCILSAMLVVNSNKHIF